MLGLADGDLVLIGSGIESVLIELLTGMLAAGGELVTLVAGHDADSRMVARVRLWLRKEHPLAEVVVHDGGQPMWPIIIGVE